MPSSQSKKFLVAFHLWGYLGRDVATNPLSCCVTSYTKTVSSKNTQLNYYGGQVQLIGTNIPAIVEYIYIIGFCELQVECDEKTHSYPIIVTYY